MFNIVRTLNEITSLIGNTIARVGQNKVDALDIMADEIIASLVQLNLLDAALGGPGNWTTVRDALADIATLTAGLNPTLNTSGTYQPIASAAVNIGSIVVGVAQWMRVGNVVNVSGSVGGDPAAAGGWVFELDLPIPSNLAVNTQLAGAFNVDQPDELPRFILGNITSNQASFAGNAVTTHTAFGGSYTYQYLVL